MQLSFFFLSLAAGSLGGVLERAVCNADNCARAVTGTRYAPAEQASHIADCSSFLVRTVTPATSYTTVTVTRSTSYSVVGSNSQRTPVPLVNRDAIAARDTRKPNDLLLVPPKTIAARQGTQDPSSVPPKTIAVRQVTQDPSSVPTYASACSGTARYSSACSCAGITQTTTYLPSPTGTTTAYTAASVIPVCDPSQNYGLQYLDGNIEDGVEFTVSDLGPMGEQACCAACFPEGNGCFVYRYFDGGCSLVIESSGAHTPTDYCPYGVFGISNQQTGNYYGFGPCAHM